MQWQIRRQALQRVESPHSTQCSAAADARPVRRRFLIVHNTIAGMRRRWLLRNVCRELKAAGAELTLLSADSLEMDCRLAEEAVVSGQYDSVVAAGGDSTVRGIGIGLRGSCVPLGMIPIGTGNVLAEEIRYRGRPRTIARHLIYGPAVSIRGGRANSTHFFAMAGAGFDARVLSRLDTRWKRRLGKLAYAWPILIELARRPSSFEVVVDGETRRCCWVIILKTSRYGGPFVITSRRTVRTDGFHAVIIDARSRVSLLSVMLALAFGRAESHRDVEVVPCRHIHIPEQTGVLTQLDGEVFGEAPLEIEPAALPLQVIFPALRNRAGCS